jgi:2-keto-3-deoxy-L-rhamnonate aldolase RhmA
VQVLLDNGVMGIVYPDVNTAAEARRAVARAKRSRSSWPKRRA